MTYSRLQDVVVDMPGGPYQVSIRYISKEACFSSRLFGVGLTLSASS